ncbi:MAG TPA: aspartate aminotransferase family protein [Acidimicrobiales bacterium]|nr:aspartate aminotransferase family protein [Acidimicrobiales bacterium]
MPAHDDLLARHRAVMPAWLSLYYEDPIEIVSGQGRHVTDGDGRQYLDFFGGILTNMVGYSIPEINDAIERQVRTGILHTSTLYLVRQQVELAEKIAALSGIPDPRVFFTNSGTEANEAALLFATSKRRSNQILALRNGYHGRSFGTMAITGNRSWSPSGYSPYSVHYVHSGYRYRSPWGDLPDAEFTAACVDDLRDVLATMTSGDVACFVAEPIQGVGGFATPPDGFFAAMKEVLDEHGILFLSDEVQTGWGRTGEHFWGYQAHGIVPDLISFAKGLGNGLAIGGVVGRADVMESLGANSLSTFGGNPLATAGAKAVIDYVVDNDLQGNALKIGATISAGLRSLAENEPLIGDVRGKGLMIGVELVVPGSKEPCAEATRMVQEQAKARGLLVGRGGLHANVLRVAPPLTITEEEAEEGLRILAESIAAAREAVHGEGSNR